MRDKGRREARRGCRVAPGVLERDLAADDGGGVLVRLAEGLRECPGDGVGQDVRAADHRDAEDDCESAQRGAQLAPEDAFEGDAGHRASSSITPITSRASERPRSRTITAPIMNSARTRI